MTDANMRRASSSIEWIDLYVFAHDVAAQALDDSRRLARTLGGDIDESPPPWADAAATFYFGYDPEGNQFGVRQQGVPRP